MPVIQCSIIIFSSLFVRYESVILMNYISTVQQKQCLHTLQCRTVTLLKMQTEINDEIAPIFSPPS